MSQPIRRSVSGQINLLRNSPLLPFEGIIEPEMVEQAVDEEGGGFVDRIYTPFVTLCAFLSEIQNGSELFLDLAIAVDFA